MDRRSMIESLFDPSGRGLEIGPSHSPFFPKAAGYRVETADHTDAAGLREKYAHDVSVDISKIESVDYLLDGRPMHEIIGKEACYDFIFSSHVIEHVPDFIAYMISCEKLLADGGVAVLAVPDKRRTFDIFQKLTSTGDIIQAHLERRRRHTPGAVFDFFANFASMNGRIAWDRSDVGVVTPVDSIDNASAKCTQANVSDEYMDVHGWYFTPSSFRLIMQDLEATGYTTLKETGVINYGGFEFFIAFSKTGAGPGAERLELLRGVVVDQIESLQSFVL
jgi:predicted SAM-dependent methyltransferase